MMGMNAFVNGKVIETKAVRGACDEKALAHAHPKTRGKDLILNPMS
jgi:hypothetical protein